MARRKPISVRLSQECEALLAGLGANQSAVIRALLLIGADASGLDLAVLQLDLRHALSCELPEAIDMRLRAIAEQLRMANRDRTRPDMELLSGSCAKPAVSSAASDREVPDRAEGWDPLTAVGFDFA
jgi:hypothetical protein